MREAFATLPSCTAPSLLQSASRVVSEVRPTLNRVCTAGLLANRADRHSDRIDRLKTTQQRIPIGPRPSVFVVGVESELPQETQQNWDDLSSSGYSPNSSLEINGSLSAPFLDLIIIILIVSPAPLGIAPPNHPA